MPKKPTPSKRKPKRNSCRVIAVTNFKGGVAKTTTASNLAAAAALAGKRVLIVDFDAQGHAGLHFGIRGSDNNGKSLWRLLSKGGDPAAHVVNVAASKRELGHRLIPPCLESVDIITSSFDLLRHGEIRGGSSGRFAAAVAALKSRYDLILVEAAPSNMDLHKSIMAGADELLIPFIPDTLSIQGTIGFLDAIYYPLKNAGLTSASVTGLLPVMVKSRTLVHEGGLKVMEQYASSRGIELLTPFVPYSVINATSMATKALPAVLGFPRSPVAEAYSALAKELKMA